MLNRHICLHIHAELQNNGLPGDKALRVGGTVLRHDPYLLVGKNVHIHCSGLLGDRTF